MSHLNISIPAPWWNKNKYYNKRISIALLYDIILSHTSFGVNAEILSLCFFWHSNIHITMSIHSVTMYALLGAGIEIVT